MVYGISGNSLPKAGSCLFFFLAFTCFCGIFLTSYSLQILFLTKKDVYTLNFYVFIYIVSINVPEAEKIIPDRWQVVRAGEVFIFLAGVSQCEVI